MDRDKTSSTAATLLPGGYSLRHPLQPSRWSGTPFRFQPVECGRHAAHVQLPFALRDVGGAHGSKLAVPEPGSLAIGLAGFGGPWLRRPAEEDLPPGLKRSGGDSSLPDASPAPRPSRSGGAFSLPPPVLTSGRVVQSTVFCGTARIHRFFRTAFFNAVKGCRGYFRTEGASVAGNTPRVPIKGTYLDTRQFA